MINTEDNVLYKEVSYNEVGSTETERLEEETVELLQSKMKLKSQLDNGTNWFFTIAGLSLLNTVLYMIGSEWSFIAGLGITQIIDDIIISIDGMGKLIPLAINVLIPGIFVAMGIIAKRRRLNAILIIGIVVYSLDTLLFLFVQDWVSIAFHLLALYGFYSAIRANNKLKKLDS